MSVPTNKSYRLILWMLIVVLTTLSPSIVSTNQSVSADTAIGISANPYGAKFDAEFSSRIDQVAKSIFARWKSLSPDRYAAYLSSVSEGIKTLAQKPAYLNNEKVQAIANYLVYEITLAKNDISLRNDFIGDLASVIEWTSTGTNAVSASSAAGASSISAAAWCSYEWSGYFPNGTITAMQISGFGNEGLACRRECNAQWAASWGSIWVSGMTYCYCGTGPATSGNSSANDRIWWNCTTEVRPSDTRFEFKGTSNAMVYDKKTGLSWQSLKGGSNSETMNWTGADSYCERLDIWGLTDWKLPSNSELRGLMDDICTGTACADSVTLNTKFFSTRPAYYWSSTPDPFDSSYAMTVFGTNGLMPNRGAGKALWSNHVRCVRSPAGNAGTNTAVSTVTPNIINNATATASTSSETVRSTGPRAALDSPTQVSETGRPVISGTANVSAVYANVVNGNGYSISGIGKVNVVNGRWSGPIVASLPVLENGTYAIKVYDDATDSLLTSWTLTVSR